MNPLPFTGITVGDRGQYADGSPGDLHHAFPATARRPSFFLHEGAHRWQEKNVRIEPARMKKMNGRRDRST